MFSYDYRLAVVRLYNAIHNMREVARMMNVSAASVSRWCRCIHKKPRTSKPRKFSEGCRLFVEGLLTAFPLLTCAQIAAKIKDVFGVSVSRQLVSTVVRKLGFTRKRCKKRVVSKRSSPERKRDFLTTVRESSSVIVAVDESGFDVRPKTVYGYGKSGHEVILKAPYCKDRNHHTLTMSIASNGEKYHAISTKSMNRLTFADYITSMPFPAGCMLIMDNASIHTTKEVRSAIEAKGYTVQYTPTYSPECNPIELAFGMIKNAFYRERYAHGFDPTTCIETNVARIRSPNIHAFFATILVP